jgi:hypothetical protein
MFVQHEGNKKQPNFVLNNSEWRDNNFENGTVQALKHFSGFRGLCQSEAVLHHEVRGIGLPNWGMSHIKTQEETKNKA